MPSTEVPPIFLHIGAMKTGTTYLQGVLREHKDRLAQDGFLFPGKKWRAQVRAAQEIAAMPQDPVLQRECEGAWDRLREEMLAHRGAASIVSMEFLSHASPDQAQTAVESLAPADVHVILTLRDATGVIPAQWQTDIRNAQTDTWPEFMRGVRRTVGPWSRLRRFAGPTAARFRRFHDVSQIVDAWAPWVPVDRFHVVTVPTSRADPTLLWRRFAGVIDLDPALGGLAQPANESMGYASTELMRRINLALGPIPVSDYNPTVREKLAPLGFAPRSAQEDRAKLDRPTFDFALRWNARAREALAHAGVRLVGELDDLPVEMSQGHARAVVDSQPPPTEDQMLAAAVDAVAAMHGVIDHLGQRATKRGIDVADLPQPDPSPTKSGSTGDSVAAAAAEIAGLCRTAIALQHRLRS